MIQAINLLLTVHQSILTIVGRHLLLFISHSGAIVFRGAAASRISVNDERMVFARCVLFWICKVVKRVLACLWVVMLLRALLRCRVLKKSDLAGVIVFILVRPVSHTVTLAFPSTDWRLIDHTPCETIQIMLWQTGLMIGDGPEEISLIATVLLCIRIEFRVPRRVHHTKAYAGCFIFR